MTPFETELWRHFSTEFQVLRDGHKPERRKKFFYAIARGSLARAQKLHFRRLVWSVFLGVYPSTESAEELSNTVKTLRNSYFSRIERVEKACSRQVLVGLDPQKFHPLSSSSDDSNPWGTQKKVEELRETIWRDVERTFPDIALFQNSTVRQSIARILWVWAWDNSTISYKQGLNELVGLLYMVASRDQDTGATTEHSPAEAQPQGDSHLEAFRQTTFSGSDHDVEADTFLLFEALMHNVGLRELYAAAESTVISPTSANSAPEAALLRDPLYSSGKLSLIDGMRPTDLRREREAAVNSTPVVVACNRVFDLLKKSCPQLYTRLSEAGVEPQVFLLRWLRLVFAREFDIEQTLVIWDSFFADVHINKGDYSPDGEWSKFEFLEHFAVSMIENISGEIMANRGMNCLQYCMNYPQVTSPRELLVRSWKRRPVLCKFLQTTKANAVARPEGNETQSSKDAPPSSGNVQHDIAKREDDRQHQALFSGEKRSSTSVSDPLTPNRLRRGGEAAVSQGCVSNCCERQEKLQQVVNHLQRCTAACRQNAKMEPAFMNQLARQLEEVSKIVKEVMTSTVTDDGQENNKVCGVPVFEL
eukprot:Lankesteria_metandrocarpae@DN5160_c0_g1_i2.p1